MFDFGDLCYKSRKFGKVRRRFEPAKHMVAIVRDKRDGSAYWYDLENDDREAFEAWTEDTFGSPDEPDGSTWEPYDLMFLKPVGNLERR